MSDPDLIFVLNKRVQLRQPADGFRTSMDSILLAAACPAEKGDTILDLGCGVGSAGLCVLERVPGAKLRGIDIQQSHIDLANENIKLNGMENRAEFICADIHNYKSMLCNHVICNPPYLDMGKYLASPSKEKVVALYHTEEDRSVKDWVEAGFYNLKAGGSFTIIHRADHADRIVAAMTGRFGGIEIIPLWPRAGEQAKRVIVRGLRDRRSPATLHPGIILHKDEGGYTPEADALLRGNASI